MVVRLALTGSLGGLVVVDWAVSTTERGNGLASSSRPGRVKGEDGGGEKRTCYTLSCCYFSRMLSNVTLTQIHAEKKLNALAYASSGKNAQRNLKKPGTLNSFTHTCTYFQR